MATKTVTLPLERAQQVMDALEVASDIVVALEWISSQQSGTHEVTGALHAIKICGGRLSEGLGDSYEFMQDALIDAAGKEVAHV